MYFQAGVNEVSFTVTIRDERLVEPNEDFFIDLEILSSAANRGVIKNNGSSSTVTVTIFDDDGEYSSSALCTTPTVQYVFAPRLVFLRKNKR